MASALSELFSAPSAFKGCWLSAVGRSEAVGADDLEAGRGPLDAGAKALLDRGFGYGIVFTLAGSFHVLAFIILCVTIPIID